MPHYRKARVLYPPGTCSRCRLYAAHVNRCRASGKSCPPKSGGCSRVDFDKGLLSARIESALECISSNEPPGGYVLAFSGGKDSIVLEHLARRSGVSYRSRLNVTSVDPPELMRFVKENYPDVEWIRPRRTMFQLIAANSVPPTRKIRYCCEYLKEHASPKGSVTLVGVRAQESQVRAGYGMVDVVKGRKVVRPILDWTSGDVWQYIYENELPYPVLYDEGFTRLGCLGCPLSNNSRWQLERYPKFRNAYLLAFSKMLENRKRLQKSKAWSSPMEVLDWWVATKEELRMLKNARRKYQDP